MKVRRDYVSNSSSSSFIVKLDRPVDDYTEEEFKSLFNYTHDHVAEKLYRHLQHCTPFYGYEVHNYDLAQDVSYEDDVLQELD